MNVSSATKLAKLKVTEWVPKTVDVDRRLWALVGSVARERDLEIREFLHEVLSHAVLKHRASRQ